MTDDTEPTADATTVGDVLSDALYQILAESARAAALAEVAEQAAPDPEPPASPDSIAQIALDLTALQARLAALTPTATDSITTKGLR